MPRTLHYGLPFLLSAVILGCATTPDLKPFADATASLSEAANASHLSIRTELLTAPAYVDFDPLSDEHPAQELSEDWQYRIDALTAVVAYTDALAAIAEAGKSGKESAEALAGAVNNLAGMLLGAPIPDSITRVATSLYGAAAEMRAARSIADAIRKADPSIQDVAGILVADLQDLDKILVQLPESLYTAIRSPYADRIEFRVGLIERRDRLGLELASDFDRYSATHVDQILKLDMLLSGTSTWYDPLQTELVAMRERIAGERALLSRTIDGVREWAAVHARMAETIEEKQPPDIRALAQVATHIRDMIAERNDA